MSDSPLIAFPLVTAHKRPFDSQYGHFNNVQYIHYVDSVVNEYLSQFLVAD